MFGSDGSPIVQYVVIFAAIFTALAAIVFLVRRLTGGGLSLPGRTGGRGRQPRLGIVDVYELDRARQLILLRRDNVEHLLLVGGPNDLVVERNIQRGQRPLPEAALRPEPAPAALGEPRPDLLSDPLVEGGRLPEPRRTLPGLAGSRAEPLFDPGFAMPVVVPAPVPGSGAAPPVTLPLDAALLASDEPGQDIGGRDIGAQNLVGRGVPGRDGAEPGGAGGTPSPRPPAASMREALSPRRFLRRAAAPPEPGPARGGAEDAAGRDPGAGRVPPPLAVPADRRSIDPAVLSDMARQLQAALTRPAAAVTPAPAEPPAPVAEAPAARETIAREAVAQEPIAREPVAQTPVPREPAAEAPIARGPDAAEPGAREPADEVPPPTPDPAAARPAPEPAEDPAPLRAVPPPARVPEADPAAPPAGRAEPEAAGNPFSVEEIEAEFARLLGRPLDKRG